MFLVHPSLKVHAGVAVAIFFGIFLVLQPWNYSSGSSEGKLLLYNRANAP